jgi:mercuric ion transport protein
MANPKITECHCAPAIPQPVFPKTTVHSASSFFLNLLIAFFPKCPMCWSAYMSLFGGVGLAHLPYMGWLFYVFLGLLGMHLFMLFRWGPQRGYMPFALCLGGSLVILCVRLIAVEPWLLNWIGLPLIACSVFWSFSRAKAA